MTDIISAGEYAAYISKLDILINNSIIQQGLGNINLALSSGGKIYLNDSGILLSNLTNEGYVVHSLKTIGNENFIEFTKFYVKNQKMNNLKVKPSVDTQCALDMWYNIFKEV